MAGTKTKTTRTPEQTFEHALRLRNQAITLIRENGQWERCGATPVMTVRNHGNLTVTYLTPFQRVAPSALFSIAAGRIRHDVEFVR
jgi:hypothetical protein